MNEAVAAALAITEPGPPPVAPEAPAVAGRFNPDAAGAGGRGPDRAGLTNRQIAEALVITEGTAANHVVHILGKLGFSSRAQVAVWAAEHGLLS